MTTTLPTKLTQRRDKAMAIMHSCCLFLDNVQLLTTLQEVEGIDNAETAFLETYKKQLHEINKNAPYRNTIFHCAGVPFTRMLDELDWTARLYCSLICQLPSGVKIFDTYI